MQLQILHVMVDLQRRVRVRGSGVCFRLRCRLVQRCHLQSERRWRGTTATSEGGKRGWGQAGERRGHGSGNTEGGQARTAAGETDTVLRWQWGRSKSWRGGRGPWRHTELACHDNTDVFGSAHRVVSGLLREHWW